MLPEVGDRISLPRWNGQFYRVTRIADDRVYVMYINSFGLLREMDYDLDNNWIIKRVEPCMEDTREYLEALSI